MRLLVLATAVSLGFGQEKHPRPDLVRQYARAIAGTDASMRAEALEYFDGFPLILLGQIESFAAREGPEAFEALRRAMPHAAWRMVLPRETVGAARRRQIELLGPDAGRSRKDFVAACLGLLDRKDADTRRLALRLLSSVRVDDVERLLPLLADPDPAIAGPAANILSRSGATVAIEALLSRWRDAGAEEARRLSYAASRHLTADATPDLVRRLKADSAQAAAVLPVLARIGDARAEAAVAELLPSLDPTVGYYALEYLSWKGGEPAAAAIRSLLDGLPVGDRRRWPALDALCTLRAPGAAAAFMKAVDAGEVDLSLYGDRLAALGDASIVPELVRMAEDPARKIQPREKAVELAGLLGGRAQVPFLLKFLKEERFADAAARALAEIGDPATALPLAEALKRAAHEGNVGAALLALPSLEGAEAPLLEILGDPEGHRFVVEAAAKAAVRLGTPALKGCLLDLIAGRTPGLVRTVEIALIARPLLDASDAGRLKAAEPACLVARAALGDAEAVGPFVAALREDPRLRGDDPARPLLTRLSPWPPGLREAVEAAFAKDPAWFAGAESLALEGTPAGAELLRKALVADNAEGTRAAGALLTLNDRQAISFLATLARASRTNLAGEERLGPILDETDAARLREDVASNLNYYNHPAVRLLAYRGDRELRSHFLHQVRSEALSNDPHPQTNCRPVALALARMKEPVAETDFLRWLRAPSAGRRALAAQALAVYGDRDAVPAIARLLDDLGAIERFEERGVRARRVREAAVDALEVLLGRSFPGAPAARVAAAREALRR